MYIVILICIIYFTYLLQTAWCLSYVWGSFTKGDLRMPFSSFMMLSYAILIFLSWPVILIKWLS
jgi:hypothetical protein